MNRPLSYRRRPGGYTLAEIVIAMGVLTIVMLAIASLSMFTARSFEALGNFSAMDRQSSFAMDMLGKDIRRAHGVAYFDTGQIILTNLDGSGVTNIWNPTNGIVTRNNNGIIRDLLVGCSYFEFQMFKRNPSNDMSFYPTTDPAQVKFISVTWQCSRPVYGMHTNIESIQTAKFGIRN